MKTYLMLVISVFMIPIDMVFYNLILGHSFGYVSLTDATKEHLIVHIFPEYKEVLWPKKKK